MKKILVINTLGLNLEGITSVIFNYTDAMNKDGLCFEFIAFDDLNFDLKKRFEKLGEIHIVHKRKKDIKAYLKDVDAVLARNYDIVHIHGNSGTMMLEVMLAKKHHVRKIITHCHNTTCDHKLVNSVLKIPMKWLATNLIACSNAAGKWLYGKNYEVLNNAINLELFKYSETKKSRLRKELGIEDVFVIGHIGHFHEQKNHEFLIDVFNEYHKIDPLSKLLLLSDGPRFDEIQTKVNSLDLDDSVIFAGRRADANEIYSVMDLFILPSLWEGLPLVMVEAQANGLPLLVSDTITKDAKCIDRVFYYSLDQGAENWAKEIDRIRDIAYKRDEDMSSKIRQHGFDIEYEANKLRNIYLAD